MPATPFAILWERGQDILVAQVAFGTVTVGTGQVNYNATLSPGYVQNKGTGPSSITPAGGGNVVTLSTTAIRGNCDGIGVSLHRMLDQIIPLDATQDNWVPILDSGDISIGEVMKQSGNILPLGYNQGQAMGNTSAPYVQATFCFGNSVHYRYYIITGVAESLRDGVMNFGKNTIQMTIKPSDQGFPFIQYGEV